MTGTATSAATEAAPQRTRFALATAIMAALLAIAPFAGIYPVFLMKALCFALFACAFNLLVGFGGLLSFGHAMFLGPAGYVTAHAAKVWGWPPEGAIVAGTIAATLLGCVTGALTIRRQGIYFAMITLALAQMIFFFYLRRRSRTARTASSRCRAASSSASSTSPIRAPCTSPCW